MRSRYKRRGTLDKHEAACLLLPADLIAAQFVSFGLLNLTRLFVQTRAQDRHRFDAILRRRAQHRSEKQTQKNKE
jgi:hypothetical protein